MTHSVASPNSEVGDVKPNSRAGIAQERAGDRAGAQATRTALLLQQRSQDAFFLTLRSQLLKKQGRTADRPGPTAG